jgi:hypothetical protein
LDQVVQRGRRRDIPIGNLRPHDHCVSLGSLLYHPGPERSDQPRYLDDGRRLASCGA